MSCCCCCFSHYSAFWLPIPLVFCCRGKIDKKINFCSYRGNCSWPALFRGAEGPPTLSGTPWRPPWSSMEAHGAPRRLMELHGGSWSSMEAHGAPRRLMELHGGSWSLHGHLHEPPWRSPPTSMEERSPWRLMELHGGSWRPPWRLMELHGAPWRSPWSAR